jgi:hypothetical protein
VTRRLPPPAANRLADPGNGGIPILLDVASVREVPWLEPGQGVFPDDLEEAERRQGVRVRAGDAVPNSPHDQNHNIRSHSYTTPGDAISAGPDDPHG